MTEPGGQRTFFYAPGTNRRLDLDAFTGLVLRDERGRLVEAIVAEAAHQLQRLGVRRRVVIHAPEGVWGQEPGQPGLWLLT